MARKVEGRLHGPILLGRQRYDSLTLIELLQGYSLSISAGVGPRNYEHHAIQCRILEGLSPIRITSFSWRASP